jgi:hypothetical protein
MKKELSNATAVGAAMMRAAHLILDESPKVCHDPLALNLSWIASESALQGIVSRENGTL